MDAWLAREAPEIDPGDLPWLKAFADGSPGRLLFAIEHDLLEWRDHVGEDLEQLCAGRYVPNLWQEFVALIDDFAKGREKANRRTSIESAKREGLDVILGMIAMELRHRMHSASGEGDHAGAERYARAIDPIVDAERRVGRSLNLKMVLADMTAALSERMQPAGGGA